jgi:hypothetical protein
MAYRSLEAVHQSKTAAWKQRPTPGKRAAKQGRSKKVPHRSKQMAQRRGMTHDEEHCGTEAGNQSSGRTEARKRRTEAPKQGNGAPKPAGAGEVKKAPRRSRAPGKWRTEAGKWRTEADRSRRSGEKLHRSRASGKWRTEAGKCRTEAG